MIGLARAALVWLTLLVSIPAFAQVNPAGHWALKAEGRTLVVLSISPDPAASGKWIGQVARPEDFHIHPGFFDDIKGNMVRYPLRGSAVAGGKLQLIVSRDDDGQKREILTFDPIDERHAALAIEGAPVDSLLLTRTTGSEEVASGWSPDRGYAADAKWPSNPQMKRIFEADQAARQSTGKIDWTVVGREDEARRLQTKELLDSGKLRSGEDFRHAAFVFQHGREPNDYLLAHTLAVVAAARGRPDATWIAAATLDRYLQSIGQKQVYGTQYSTRPGQPTTQDPYDRTLISDALRSSMGVPPQSEQEKRRAEIDLRHREQATQPKQ